MRPSTCTLVRAAIALALSLAALGGCGKAGDAPAGASIASLPTTAVPAAGSGRSLPLPGDFPGDVYLPSGYAVDSVLHMDGALVLSLRAPGSVDTLFADARAAMQRLGWRQTMAVQHAGDSAMLSYEKDDRTAVLSLSGNHDSDDLTVNLQLRRRRR